MAVLEQTAVLTDAIRPVPASELEALSGEVPPPDG